MISLPIDTLLSTEIENNLIPSSAITHLSEKFLESGNRKLNSILDAMFSWNNSASPWRKWIYNDGTYQGTWTKRFASHCFREYSIKLPDEVVELIGNTLGKTVEKEIKKYFFEITHFMDWRPGDFQEREESCWWNSKKSSRIGLSKLPDGYAVLFYRGQEEYSKYAKKRGIGRCFSLNTEKGLVIFNAYGIELTTIAIALSNQLGLAYQRVSVYSEGAWINGGMFNNEGGGGGDRGVGFIIGSENVIRGMDSIDIGEIALDEVCHHCNSRMRSEEGRIVNGGIWCRNCFTQEINKGTIFGCKGCGDTFSHGNKVIENGTTKTFCDECYNKLPVCDVHGHYVGKPISVWHSAKKACPQCMQEGLICTCFGCRRTVDKFVTITLPHNKIKLCLACGRKASQDANT